MTKEWKVEYWERPEEIEKVGFSEYWNDESQEANKEFNIQNGDFSKMETYLKASGLSGDATRCFQKLSAEWNIQPSGVGIDLAAGNLWAAPVILKNSDINKLYCLEFSRHRLLDLGPKVLEHYGIEPDKVILALGSFYEIKLPDRSIDLVFMSQAFHHAGDPHAMLKEVLRVLKGDGTIIIIGENMVDRNKALVKHIAKYLISRALPASVQKRLFGRTFSVRSLLPGFGEIIPHDPVLGDFFYTNREYAKIFKDSGLSFLNFTNPAARIQSFILRRSDHQ